VLAPEKNKKKQVLGGERSGSPAGELLILFSFFVFVQFF
jgi:hypothetical protein